MKYMTAGAIFIRGIREIRGQFHLVAAAAALCSFAAIIFGGGASRGRRKRFMFLDHFYTNI